MILKPSFFLLVLTASQAFSTSVHVLKLRGLEILESRQAACPVCTAVSQTLSTCDASGTSTIALRCACNSAVASQVQACVDCGVAANIGSLTVQQFVDSYNQRCSAYTTTGGSGATAGGAKASSGTSDKGRRAGVATIGAIVGAALLL